MKKITFPKKYPLLVSTIVSCLLIIVSLFILGFFGLRLGVSLGGGSRFEVAIEQSADVKDYSAQIKDVLSEHGLNVDTSFVEDNYRAGEGKTEYLKQRLVIQIAKKDISEEERVAIRQDIIAALQINPEYVSEIQQITSSVKAKEVLFIALALGIVAICFFVFGWLRYGVLIGLSFIIAFLHNIILYLSVLILTRVQLTLMSLVAAIILSLVMSIVLISIYEKYRELSRLSTADKTNVSNRMLDSERQSVKPFIVIMLVALVVSVAMLFVPSGMVRNSAAGIIFALLVTLYTTLIIGPASCTGFLEIRDMNQKAILSRNENVNKAIKKKVQKAQSKANETKKPVTAKPRQSKKSAQTEEKTTESATTENSDKE